MSPHAADSRDAPAPAPFRRPLQFLAFGFGSGLSPWAPGTAGTLVAVPLYWLVAEWSLPWYTLFVLATALLGIGICGAAETLLVDEACMATHLAPIVRDLLDAGCEVRGDAAVQAVDPRVRPATEDDWYTEYLDAVIAAMAADCSSGATASTVNSVIA